MLRICTQGPFHVTEGLAEVAFLIICDVSQPLTTVSADGILLAGQMTGLFEVRDRFLNLVGREQDAAQLIMPPSPIGPLGMLGDQLTIQLSRVLRIFIAGKTHAAHFKQGKMGIGAQFKGIGHLSDGCIFLQSQLPILQRFLRTVAQQFALGSSEVQIRQCGRLPGSREPTGNGNFSAFDITLLNQLPDFGEICVRFASLHRRNTLPIGLGRSNVAGRLEWRR